MTDSRIGRGHIEVAEISKALGAKKWPVQRVRRWLVRHQAAIKLGTRWYTTREMLRSVFPEIYGELGL